MRLGIGVDSETRGWEMSGLSTWISIRWSNVRFFAPVIPTPLTTFSSATGHFWALRIYHSFHNFIVINVTVIIWNPLPNISYFMMLKYWIYWIIILVRNKILTKSQLSKGNKEQVLYTDLVGIWTDLIKRSWISCLIDNYMDTSYVLESRYSF